MIKPTSNNDINHYKALLEKRDTRIKELEMLNGGYRETVEDSKAHTVIHESNLKHNLQNNNHLNIKENSSIKNLTHNSNKGEHVDGQNSTKKAEQSPKVKTKKQEAPLFEL